MSCTRRTFLGACAVAGAVGTLGFIKASAASAPSKLRAITYNVLGCKGYAETAEAEPYLKRAASQMPARIAQELALYEPDIVTFQEGPDEATVAEIARLLGMRQGFFASGFKSSKSYPVGFPGAIITRFPIQEVTNRPMARSSESADLFTRHWGRAVLQYAGGPLVVYSAHLHPSDDSIREREITEALAVMKKDMDHGAPLMLIGDLNHKPDGADYPRWRAAGLVDTFRPGPGVHERTFGSHKPEKRIDYIWAYGSLAKQPVECRVLFEGAFRTNPEDPRSFALSDHIPVLATFG